MAITLKHKKNSTVADSANADMVQPSDWNNDHDLNSASGVVLGRPVGATPASGPVQELPIGGFVQKEIDTGLGFYTSVLKPSVATGTVLKPVKSISNFQMYGNTGNFELQAPDSEAGGAYTMLLYIWAASGAGAMSTTGFSAPPKGTFAPLASNLLTIRVIDTAKFLTIEAMT